MSTQQTPPPIIAVTSIVARERNALCSEVDPDRRSDVLEVRSAEPDETSCADEPGATASGVPPREPTMM